MAKVPPAGSRQVLDSNQVAFIHPFRKSIQWENIQIFFILCLSSELACLPFLGVKSQKCLHPVSLAVEWLMRLLSLESVSARGTALRFPNTVLVCVGTFMLLVLAPRTVSYFQAIHQIWSRPQPPSWIFTWMHIYPHMFKHSCTK